MAFTELMRAREIDRRGVLHRASDILTALDDQRVWAAMSDAELEFVRGRLDGLRDDVTALRNDLLVEYVALLMRQPRNASSYSPTRSRISQAPTTLKG